MNLRSFFKGEERTVRAKKNILASIIIKGIDSLVYLLLLIPVTLGYLDKNLGRTYVSTTFFILVALMLVLILIGTLCESFIDWYDILSTIQEQVPHLKEIVYVAFAIFCLNFILKFIGNVYLAMQLPAINNLMIVSGHLLSLIVIYIFTLTISGSQFWVAIAYSTSPLIIYLLADSITFNKIYPYFKPSIHLPRHIVLLY